MGMFDRLYVPLKCPTCGDEGDKELQTKDLRCYLDEYRVGASIGTTQFRWLDCTACCDTAACRKKRDEELGYRSGFGSSWDCFAEIDDDGCITGRVVTEIPEAKPRREQ